MTTMPTTQAPPDPASRDTMRRFTSPVPFDRLTIVQLRIWRAQRGFVAATIAVIAITMAATAAGVATHHGAFTQHSLGQQFAVAGGVLTLGWLVVGAIAGAAPFRSRWSAVVLAIAPRRLRWFTSCVASVLAWALAAAIASGLLACGGAAVVLAAQHKPVAASTGVLSYLGSVTAGALFSTAVGFLLGAAARSVTVALVLGVVVAPLIPLLNSAPGHLGDWLDLSAATREVGAVPGAHWGLPVMTSVCLWLVVPALVATWRLRRSQVA